MPGPARVIVPGGGPFADAVRALQPALGMGELVAHRMAILAMQQFGLALQALEPRLGLAETARELRSAHGRGLASLASRRPLDLISRPAGT